MRYALIACALAAGSLAAQEAVVNGSFEQGTTGWSGTTQNIGQYTDRPNYDGAWHAWLGGYGRVQSDDLRQNVTIPSDATKATLRFALNVTTSEVNDGRVWDTCYVQVLDSGGTQVLATLASFTNLNAGGGYKLFSYDLTAYRGRTVQLRFYTVEDDNTQTSWDLDQVSLAVTRAAGLDLTVDNVYATQSTQRYGKSVPLVENRRGLVRVFVRANQANTARPNVKLRFYYNGALGHEMTLPPNSGMSGVPTSINENNYTASYNATVPKDWIRQGLQLWAQVDPEGAVAEANEANNVWPSGSLAAENVKAVPTFKVMLVPLRLASTGRTSVASTSNAETYVEFLRRMHPVPEDLDVQVHAVYTTNAEPDPNYGSGWTQVWNEMNALRKAEGGWNRHYYGCLNPNYTSGGTGLGVIGGFYAVGVEWTGTISNGTSNWRAGTFAHEVGHNFGRYHSPCGGASGTDPNYPYANASIGVPGYDVWNNRYYDPTASNAWSDVMAYCGYDWISDYTYTGAMNWRIQNAAGLGFAAGAPGQAPGAVQDCLLVWGRMEGGKLVLEPAFPVRGVPDAPASSGDLALEARDAAGRLVLSHAVALDEADHGGARSFAVLVPLPQTLKAGAPLAELRAVKGTETLARAAAAPQARAAAAPTVARATRDQVRVVWDAAAHPVVMAKDPATGEVLGFLRHGDARLQTRAAEVELHFSDGVGTVVQRYGVK